MKKIMLLLIKFVILWAVSERDVRLIAKVSLGNLRHRETCAIFISFDVTFINSVKIKTLRRVPFPRRS